MIWVLLAVAILSAAFGPAAPVQEPEPPEEIRIGDVAKVEDIDEVKDANAENGWYKKTKGGWMFWPEDTVDGTKPPKAELAAFMNSEIMQSAAGLVIIVLLFAAVFRGKRRKKKKANDKEMKRITGGVSQAEFQALMRQVAGMSQILQSLLPNSRDTEEIKGKGRRKRWI